MSLDPILWALKDAPVADSLERLILVVLAEHAGSSDGCSAFPSRDTIASLAIADPKTVQRVIQRLIKRKLIARGDQSAARYIRADRRPVVYDLLIPYSWFPNPERMNEERRKRGLPPLTPDDRPDIAPAPEKARRKDMGVPRKKTAERGDSKSPRESRGQSGHGGTVSPARGDSQSRTGGLEDPRTSSKNHPKTLSPRGRAHVGDPATVAPVVEEREKAATPKDKHNRQPATALPGQRAGEVDQLESVPAPVPGAFQEFQAPVPAAPHTTPQTAPQAAAQKPAGSRQTAEELVRAAKVVQPGEEAAFVAWATKQLQPRGLGWWRTLASNGDLAGHAADWQATLKPTAAALAAEQPAWWECARDTCSRLSKNPRPDDGVCAACRAAEQTAQPVSTPDTDQPTCPGHNGEPCGRPVKADGLCARCGCVADTKRLAATRRS